MCKYHLWQTRLQKNIFDLSSVDKAVPVCVGSCKHLVILSLLYCCDNPLAASRLTSTHKYNYTKQLEQCCTSYGQLAACGPHYCRQDSIPQEQQTCDQNVQVLCLYTTWNKTQWLLKNGEI